MNNWPAGKKHAMSQLEHAKYNAKHTPGTRQMCYACDEPTGRCENDSLYAGEWDGPLCEDCYDAEVPREG